MGKLKWYKRDPDAALGGMMALTLEERGAYCTILDLIYSHADELPDDDRFLAGWCKCDLRVWRRIKARLISLGKLHVQGGCIRNFRATSGVDEALGRVQQASDAAEARWSKSSAAAKEIKDIGDARAMPQQMQSTTTTISTTRKELHTPSPEPAPSARGVTLRAITDDFRPSEADRQAIRKGRPDLSDSDLDRRTREFIDWNISKANTSADWGRSWRSFVTKTREVGSAEPAAAIDWNRACEQFKRVGIWPYWAGNKPGIPGCECPRDILAKHGLLEAA